MAHFRHIRDIVADLLELERAGFGTQAVGEYLLTSRIEPASLEPYFNFDESHYTRNLIHRTDCFELLALCWDISQASPVHDHENERCWARVEQGTLRFTGFRLLTNEPLCLERVDPPITGTAGYVDAVPGIHRVENHVAFGQRAVSLHLYSRPFAECAMYDLDKGEMRRLHLRYDTAPGLEGFVGWRGQNPPS
jgi:cysteine dioxygenase